MKTLIRNRFSLLVLSLALCLFVSSCKDKEYPDFHIVRQTLQDGDEVDALLTLISFTYSQPIEIADASLITLTDAEVTSSAAGAMLNIEPSGMVGNHNYTLTVAKGAIRDINGQELPEVSVNFSTIEREIIINLAVERGTGAVQAEAKKLYDFLRENYGKKMLSATMANVNFNTNEAQWVYKHTGKWPAMTCIDFIHLGEDFVNYENMTEMQDWWDNNGIILAGWHWNVPTAEGSELKAFYKENNQFSASNALTAGTWENKFMTEDIQNVAAALKRFKDAGIPVIWRPFHEASGGWFWWGAEDADTYIKLWKWMFTELAVKNKLDNLIWVWTSQGDDQDWYPGDQFVDIIGRDLYNVTDAKKVYQEYAKTQSMFPNRIVTLSECGTVATANNQWVAGSRWSWFMPWYDAGRTKSVVSNEFNGTNHEHANITWWQAAFSSPFIMTRDDMPALH